MFNVKKTDISGLGKLSFYTGRKTRIIGVIQLALVILT